MSIPQPTPQPDPAAEVSRLVEFLSGQDVPCPLCGYNLRGLTGDVCPECGRRLQLTVGLSDPFLHAWIMLAAAMFSAAGIGVLFIIIVVFIATYPPPGEIVRAMAYFVLAIPGSALTVVFRRRLLRLPKERQLLIAWASIVTTALGFAYLVWFAAR